MLLVVVVREVNRIVNHGFCNSGGKSYVAK